jgi:hypothetical protein
MRRIYLQKARLAGTEMIADEHVQDWSVTFAQRVLRTVPSGTRLLALLLLCTLIAAIQFVRRRAAVLLVVVMMGVTATLLMLESIIIVPRYYLTYHSSLLLLFCALTFICVQVAFNGLATLISFAKARQPLPSST